MINTTRVISSCCCSKRRNRAVFFELNGVLLETEKTPWLRYSHPCKKPTWISGLTHLCLPNLVLFFLKHLSLVFEGSCYIRIFIPNIEFSSWEGPFWKDNEARARISQPKWEGKIGFSQSANSFLGSRAPVGQKIIPGCSTVSLYSSRDHSMKHLIFLVGKCPSTSLACPSPGKASLLPETGITLPYSFQDR